MVQDKEANVELGLDGEDAVNERYMEALDNLKNRRAIPIPERSQGDLDLAAKDYYANVRTNVRCLRADVTRVDAHIVL